MAKLRFGYFIAPFHRAGTNPTLALQRDLEFVQHLDALGFDEAWIGEHHSAGSELIASPEIFIAAAAERTKWIKLCTGVISLAYHNPLWVADRLMMLDHLTHGRVIGGVGPGSLPSDSSMIGLTPTDTRELLETNLDIVVRLLRGETVSAKTPTHELHDAQLQLAPYSDGGVPLAVAAVASPTGARLAGKHGIGLLSIGATLTIEGLQRAAVSLGHRRRARGGVRHQGRSQELEPGRAVPHRRNRQAGPRGREIRPRAVVPVLPEGGRFPADDHAGRADRRDDRRHQRQRRGCHRHAGAGARTSAADVGSVRRVRLHAADGPRVGQPGGDQTVGRVVRRRSDAAFSGAGAADTGRRRARQRRREKASRSRRTTPSRT